MSLTATDSHRNETHSQIASQSKAEATKAEVLKALASVGN
jgi:hypothetical protein